jgi:VWFA-related protein
MRMPAAARRRAAIVVATAAALVGATLGSAPRADQPPAFRAGVDLVAVDFLALAKDGSSVRDLMRDDVTLRVDGRARDVRSLQFVELAHARDEGVLRATPPLAMPFGSNRLADAGRAIVITVDRDSIHPGQEEPIRSAVGHFLNRLTASDRVAFVTLPRSPNEVGLTRDLDRIREAVLETTGQAPQTQTDDEKTCRSRETLFALTQLIEPLAVIDGPKTVVLVSSGLLSPKQDFARFNTARNAPPLGSPPAAVCDIKPDYFDAVGAAAEGARAHLYVIQSEVVRSDPSVTSADYSGLESLAGVTGGDVLPLLGGDEAFRRVARESAGYYLLAFAPEASERNGVSHRIELRVARENVTLRARPGFVIPKARPPAARANAKEMLRDAAPFRDLPLRVVAYASRNAGDSRLKVVAIAEPLGTSDALTSASIGLIDVKGRLTAQWTAEAEELKTRPLAAALTAAPGRYRVRVAAVDSAGRTGAADYEFDARLIEAGPLKLSTMALGVVRDGQFAPVLQFRDEQAAVAYFEIYGTPKAGALSASLDIAAADGIQVGTLPIRIIQTSDEDRRIATAVIPLDSLPAGDYVVQAVVGVADRPTGKAQCTLRRVVRTQ